MPQQSIPANLRYTQDHEWAREDHGLIVVGITHHAVEQLGDITMLTLPAFGATITRGEQFGDIDSVKAVSELIAPMSGTIVEINSELETNPELINADPYQQGWILKLKPTAPETFAELLSPAQYTQLVQDGS